MRGGVESHAPCVPLRPHILKDNELIGRMLTRDGERPHAVTRKNKLQHGIEGDAVDPPVDRHHGDKLSFIRIHNRHHPVATARK